MRLVKSEHWFRRMESRKYLNDKIVKKVLRNPGCVTPGRGNSIRYGARIGGYYYTVVVSRISRKDFYLITGFRVVSESIG